MDYGAEEIGTLTWNLARFYRLSLNHGKSLISIGEEVEHVEVYVNIENYHFDNAISLEVDVPEELKSYACLNIILQPFVENAIVHGFENVSTCCKVTVTAAQRKNRMHFEITDTGIGMSHDTLSHTHLTGFPSQRDALLGRRVPRCENDIRFGTYLHDSHDFRQHTPVIVHNGHTLFLAVIADILVNGILCRHPDTTTKIPVVATAFSTANTFTLSPCTRFIHRLPNTSDPCNS
mgnify:CR=1 FL=1